MWNYLLRLRSLTLLPYFLRTRFFLILTTLLRHNRNAAILVCCGVAFGNAVIIALVFIGLQLLINIDKSILVAIKWIGILYLFYLSYLCIRYAKSPLNLRRENNLHIRKEKYISSKVFNLACLIQKFTVLQ